MLKLSHRKSGLYDSSIIDNAALDPMNYYGRRGIPFLFVIDYLAKDPFISPITNISKTILYSIEGFTNVDIFQNSKALHIQFDKYPVAYITYYEAFTCVQEHLRKGNSYLVNLTFPTRVITNLSLYEIFIYSCAPYKLFFNNQFVVFSPESFITIANGYIYTYPMKGTIDASMPNAKETLLNDAKEFAEHITVVDLLRNDLAKVAYDVTVENFRFCSTVKTHNKALLQTSSLIRGTLYKDYNEHLGNIFASLLPAGSVTGAPKKKTVEIIHETEIYERGYYTGVFGYFDGKNLKSAVMIRFIENNGNDYSYKSGGGITIYSNPRDEYNEMVDKVYVPVN